ncbi:MerR family transcriptional regulator [Candidatus Soleaferrea massiliensis]|uniref:MerR family transcriptional regulator n=1 Tax=Candidatus Soleaferrea massiliensis TaxID=1470354 RepID=UPI000590222B|nr:GyrI-like domain-containing protein [Candidatus Soleaferrea massiliensis]
MFTIGEFARLGQVSARMLRHYDQIGLFSPALVGENGYRLYDVSQLATLEKIETLKGYGFTLSEISGLLPLSGGQLALRIHQKRIAAYDQLNELRRTLRRMEDDIFRMEGKNLAMEHYHVILMNSPAQRVFSIRKRINIGQVGELFDELLEEMKKRGLVRTGACQMLYHGEEFSYDDMDAEAQVQVSGEHPDVKEVPEMLCAATTHIGPYDTVKYAYEAIGNWMREHPQYQVCAPAIERYLKDVDEVNAPEELETGILFPVKKIDG